MIVYLLLVPLVLAAFLVLCLANPRHQGALVGQRLDGRLSRRLRRIGWLLLLLACALAWAAFGFGRGTVIFAGYATFGAAGIVAFLNRRSAAR
jgi:hypothetical protein